MMCCKIITTGLLLILIESSICDSTFLVRVAKSASNLDLVVAQDSSGSVRQQDFRTSIAFFQSVHDVLKKMQKKEKKFNASFGNLTQDEYRLGFLTFSNEVSVHHALTKGENINKLDIPYNAGGTNICRALEKATEMLQDQSSTNRHRVIVLLTDGQDNGCHPRNDRSIEVIAIGIGNGVDTAAMRSYSDVFIPAHNFNDLEKIKHKLVKILTGKSATEAKQIHFGKKVETEKMRDLLNIIESQTDTLASDKKHHVMRTIGGIHVLLDEIDETFFGIK